MQDYAQEMLTFAKVAQVQSFTGAAAALGKSKAFVSNQINRLEEHLGFKLLYRSTRHVSLTDSGKLFLPYCERLQANLSEAQHLLDDRQNDQGGDIRLTIPLSLGRCIIESWLPEFQREFPNIRFCLNLSNTPINLLSGNYDLAIRATNLLSNQDYVAIHLTEFRYALFASDDYLSRYGKPAHPLDISKHRGILHSDVDTDNKWYFRTDASDEPLGIAPLTTMMIDSSEGILHAVKQGLGIGRLPEYVVYDQPVQRLLSAFELPPVAIQLIYPYQGTLPRRLRLFVDYLKQRRNENSLSISSHD
ncbi:LysR family transcriptional regulator [Maribrevibacterium harenarium]|uniref:LysR family transcriptional regulator n=1 Tax=Maribrevibacterium harenarium TaxID=2589817 RepID=A0A501WL14_9GAMM|nr:LysR family transcriptional regulator [Maribrevibacterium harenarium]TPE49462.1 LysR family transcriptional regulator [Maribrevibacterium harenarium]